MTSPRYAIYVLPEPDALSSFGAAWLGWDARIGAAAQPPKLPDLPAPWEEITRTPRKYGFHGTIKPPFQLARDKTEAELREALSVHCALTCPVMLDALELARLGRFLALIPVGDVHGLNTLAADVVRGFDSFRAPPGETELARRHQSNLSTRQEALLQAWGYPYVMDQFRFHMTLTGKLPKVKADTLASLLAPIIAPLLPVPFVIGSLSLMVEGTDGMFRQIERFALSGWIMAGEFAPAASRGLAACGAEAYATTMAQMTVKRLTKTDWIAAGFAAVVQAGPDMLKAEPLARRLGTTKGSFYWHFADVPAFHAALLSAWETQAIDAAIAAVASQQTPVAKLRHLAQLIAENPAADAVDPSIRAWGRGNPLAAQAVARVDAERLAYIQELLSELDIDNPEMARIIYGAGVGMDSLGASEPGENTRAIGSLVDLILALR